MNKLRIISRNSKLALVQASFVSDKIKELYPDLEIEIIGITTQGDKILDKTLDKIGGKGLFIKELQQHLLDGTADLAVHSLKDLPAESFADFIIPAVLPRIDARDCFVSNTYSRIDDMPFGSVVGTSSARRVALLQQYYPNLKVKMLRGNIQTRLNKLDNKEYDGIILAVAGLKRLGLDSRINHTLDPKKFVPAIGQGVLALEILSKRLDLMLLLAMLDDNKTYLETEVERNVGKLLGASCSVPIGVFANIQDNQLFLSAIVANNGNHKFIKASISDNKENYLNMSTILVDELKHKGKGRYGP